MYGGGHKGSNNAGNRLAFPFGNHLKIEAEAAPVNADIRLTVYSSASRQELH